MMQKEGKTPIEAVIEAARMRLRPILMTSLAFILGVLPLVISHGAGSGAQNAVGTGVMGRMFAAALGLTLCWFRCSGTFLCPL
ncbi:efflux RND transporter permease subunit [Escherichia coli]